MIYNYTITTKLKEIKKGNEVYSKVLKDVSITASEALKLYLRHHKKFADKMYHQKACRVLMAHNNGIRARKRNY